MKRFSFRLAKLEKLRDRRKRDARVALAGALAEARDRENHLGTCRTELEQAIRDGLPPALSENPRALRELAAWRGGLHGSVVHASARLEEAGTVVEERSGEYREASRAHRVLELLRQRRFRRWLEEAQTEERKFLDEIYLLRLARARTGKED